MANHRSFQWAVIGAGPAGIAAVGTLLDHGVQPATILWLDPDFQVGDLGRFWQNVSSNTKAAAFLDFLHAVKAFRYEQRTIDFAINHVDSNKTCLLRHIVEPLQWITAHLVDQISAVKQTVHKLTHENRHWMIHCSTTSMQARYVILATGATPLSLPYAEIDVIPFEIAIDHHRLQACIKQNDTYAVFGSSHSAMMILKHLIELKVQRVINFYRSPCRYALDMGEWTLFDFTGLKGEIAHWAQQYIDGKKPRHLERYISHDSNINRYLAESHHVIYAIGFKRRNLIAIGDYEHLPHNPHVGILAPGLFGLGIAYPEQQIDRLGNIEERIGLWSFLQCVTTMMPIWFNYPA